MLRCPIAKLCGVYKKNESNHGKKKVWVSLFDEWKPISLEKRNNKLTKLYFHITNTLQYKLKSNMKKK